MHNQAVPLLSALTRSLSRAPYSLTELLNILKNTEDYVWFVNITRKYLPEAADDILGESNPAYKTAAFLTAFEQKYFGLYHFGIDYLLEIYFEDNEPPYGGLKEGIPYLLRGFSYEDMHYLWEHYGKEMGIMGTIPRPCDRCAPRMDTSMRTEWLETASAYVPEETLKRIPEDGISSAKLYAATEGTRYQPLGDFGRWLWSETGNFFLDFAYEDGIHGFSDPWTDENINYAKEMWEQADSLVDRVNDFGAWLAADPPKRFAQTLDHVLANLPEGESNEH